MAFKMKGFTPFTKNKEYDPQTITRKDPDTDAAPQSTPKKRANIQRKTMVKTQKKKSIGTKIKEAIPRVVANVIGGPVGNLIYDKAKEYDKKNPPKRKGYNQPPGRKI